MDLSIVITTRNRKKDLLECIDSIKESDFKNIEYELIIVDDASDDGTEKITNKDINLDTVKIIHNDIQQMMVRSRNIGAKNSSGNYVLFIDDDNIIDKEMIPNLISFADYHEDYGMVGPSMYFFESKEKYMDYQKISLITGKTNYFIGNDESNHYDSDGIPNVFMIKKEAFEICGYFDESLIQTYTEPDFAKMIEQRGFKSCVVSKAKTYHKIKKEDDLKPISMGGKFKQKAYCLMRNRIVYIARYGNFFNKLLYTIFFSWFWPCVYSFFALKNKRLDLVKLYWRGFIDGMVYLFTGKLKSTVDIN